MKIFCLGSNSLFTRKVAFYLGIELGKVNVSKFSDGEIFIEIGENVRGEDCFLVQTLYPNSSEAIMTLVLAADTLKRASAGRVTAVIPYFAYMRQDRKVRPRVPISFKALANILVALSLIHI
ncbi:MAG: ribose-phosphate pyrophosphokinase-like domain-containing protein, partial [Deltaproteobacteria bacterium]|nr:ribose-phosphate pyrophosphokinase-like domain-containing protein [Deltaproteobacteria bacterium]